MELESVQVYEFNGGDDVQLLIRKGMATYQPSTPELKEIANRANSHDALKETLRLKEEENKQLADENKQLRSAIESSLRIKELWIPNNLSPENQGEGEALCSMARKFEQLTGGQKCD